MIIIIGKCREIYKDNNLPSIKDLIQNRPIDFKDIVLRYLKNGKKGACAAGRAIDFISGEVIPGALCCYTDGKYGWRSDTIFYFEKYNLKLEDEFLSYVLDNN